MSRDRLVVRTLRCGRSNPGSNPGLGSCVGGIVVSIAAFQAVDPGSIPGRRSHNFGQLDENYEQNAQACRDQDSNLGYCGHNAGS